MVKKQKILVIVGPTASGKSALGVSLAKRLKGEIISADSRQVYKGLDIGTGKITKKEMRGIPHHLLDIVSPKKTVTAQEFTEKARSAINAISKKARLPLVVGGTGFYIDSLLGRITLPDVPPNKKLRESLHKKNATALYTQLKKLDAKRAKAMSSQSERNNKVRLVRAIEIAKATTSTIKISRRRLDIFDVLWIGISPEQKLLEKKIEKRLSARIKQGMIQEAKRLRKNHLSLKRMESLGLEYRSLARFLKGVISKEELEAELFRDIRRYAKKQRAYWKRNTDIMWFKPTDTAKIRRKVTEWLRK